jgi:hypothetical protein
MTTPLLVALDGATTITNPTSDQLAGWAYDTHCQTCATCRRGDTWCERGRALLAATAHILDTPGYPAI